MLQNVKNNSSPQKHWYNCFMVWYGMVWYGMVWYGMGALLSKKQAS